MKKIVTFITLTTISFCAVFLSSASAASNNTYNRLIIFGDSYSDNGNDFKISHGKYPNEKMYYQGRFSDGPVWAEYFAQYFGINTNNQKYFIDIAYGQAKVLSGTTITVLGQPSKRYPIPDLSQQIDSYVKQYKAFNSDDLIAVFISTNDFFDLPHKNANLFFQKIADQEIKQIDRLIQLGAKHIIVLNGRDVTYSPLAEIFARNETHSNSKKSIDEYLQNFRQLIQAYNNRLSHGLKNKKQVYLYDIYKFDNLIISQIQNGGFHYQMNSSHYVLKDVKSGCYQNNQGDYQGIAGPICRDPQHYFFYDRIHTTRYVNYLLAKDIYTGFSMDK